MPRINLSHIKPTLFKEVKVPKAYCVLLSDLTSKEVVDNMMDHTKNVKKFVDPMVLYVARSLKLSAAGN